MGLFYSLITLSLQYLLFFFLLFSSMITNCFPSVHNQTHECHADESYALLHFKESFVISEHASYNPFSYPKTVSWKPTTDCCLWDGIECDEISGHVIAIHLSSSQLYGSIDANSTLFSLVHLQWLDLSDNHFNHSQIPAKIRELSQLTHLNLSQFSESTFSGEVPHEISLLANLLSLDLRSYIAYFPLDPINQLRLNISTLRSLIQNSTRIQQLRLNCVTISSSVPNMLTNLTYLQKLSLANCELYGEFPVEIFHLPNIETLNLAYNWNLRGMLPDFQSSSPINHLSIQGTSFYGSIPPSLGNLNQLVYLDLGSNYFTIDTIPLFIANLTQLSHLSLEGSSLGGQIPSWIGNLTNLAYLDLGSNMLHGEIPHSLFRLVNLRFLSLSFNLLQGQLELEMFLKLKMLSSLSLSYNKLSLITGNISPNFTLPPIQKLILDSCNLSGEIPFWIMNLTTLSRLSIQDNNLQGEVSDALFRLENLDILSLSRNFLEGELELDMFLKLKRLTYLDLSYNYNLSLLTGKVSPNTSLPPLEVLDLDRCNLVEFPKFFQDLDELALLFMSSNDLKSIPNWLWRKRNLLSLSISYSSITGEISPLICNLNSLVELDLSYNNLSGMIPPCLGNISQLQLLILRGNKLIGRIPETYAIGSALKKVDFSENNLEGQLPRAIVNCKMLEVFDVSHNQISDSFPCWLSTLPELKVIALRHNELYGAIMCPKRCAFPKLHIIDLSHNKFSGNLPSKTIKNWKSMSVSNTSQLEYNSNTIVNARVSFVIFYPFTMNNKGVPLNYEELQRVYYMVAIDLSSNRISGEIPEVLGDLKSLVLLNLSNNMLHGNIPSSLGKLSNLEALDLSLNNLSGKIPQQLTKLTFLEFFNVSFNNLSGSIPDNKQFSTFRNDSFEGNQGLCGIQLFKNCEDHVRPLPPEAGDDQDSDQASFFEYSWKIILIGYVGGFVAGLTLENTFNQSILQVMERMF